MTMSVDKNLELGRAICEALGLDPTKIKAIHIALEAGSVAMVHVVEFLSSEEGDKAATVFRKRRFKEDFD